eukprot:11208869-Lingulodinium_polyedra.AAC.1
MAVVVERCRAATTPPPSGTRVACFQMPSSRARKGRPERRARRQRQEGGQNPRHCGASTTRAQ